MKKTVLHEEHQDLNAKMADFAGFTMPVVYSSIKEEHHQVRNHVGVFDLSHMGELRFQGKDAFPFLQGMIANNMKKLKNGKILYTPLCNSEGGVIDDLLVYQINPENYLLVVNASNREKVFQALQTELKKTTHDLTATDESDKTALIALQGPKSASLMTSLGFSVRDLPYYHFSEALFSSKPIMVSRTGYTGEDGFEIFLPHSLAKTLWSLIMDQKKPDFPVLPIGLGARDTLRLEVCFCLYGHELDETISPLEAGLNWAIDLKKPHFQGKAALLHKKTEQKPHKKRKLVGFEMEERGIARQGYAIWADNTRIGFVTSGSLLPTLNKTMGLALIQETHATLGADFEIEIRSKRCKAKIVPKPFYLPLNRRPPAVEA